MILLSGCSILVLEEFPLSGYLLSFFYVWVSKSIIQKILRHKNRTYITRYQSTHMFYSDAADRLHKCRWYSGNKWTTGNLLVRDGFSITHDRLKLFWVQFII